MKRRGFFRKCLAALGLVGVGHEVRASTVQTVELNLHSGDLKKLIDSFTETMSRIGMPATGYWRSAAEDEKCCLCRNKAFGKVRDVKEEQPTEVFVNGEKSLFRQFTPLGDWKCFCVQHQRRSVTLCLDGTVE